MLYFFEMFLTVMIGLFIFVIIIRMPRINELKVHRWTASFLAETDGFLICLTFYLVFFISHGYICLMFLYRRASFLVFVTQYKLLT